MAHDGEGRMQGLLSGAANATCDERAAAVRGRDIPTAARAAEEGMACVFRPGRERSTV